MKGILGILIFLLLTGDISAQRICGSVDYNSQLLKANPLLQVSYNKVEDQIKKTLLGNNKARDTFSNEIINIPVVIHILYNSSAQNISDAQVQSQIDALNKDFSYQNADRINAPAVFKSVAADSKFKFCIAQVDPQGKKTNGIIRKHTNTQTFTADDAMKYSLNGGDNSWDSKKYLNIWVCNLGGRSLGYSTLPGDPVNLDGVVIAFDAFGTTGTLRPLFNKGRTATHEVGHWLGLKHVWGDTDCGDDGVDDTPRQQSYNFGCPTFPRVTNCSIDANGDMFMNYMDFSDDACMNMFTIGQKKRMRALFASGNFRNSFLTSFACDSNLVQGGPVANTTDTSTSKVTNVVTVVKLFPNPVQSYLTIECNTASKQTAKTISIFNLTGLKVFTSHLENVTSTFNLNAFAPGMYFIKIGEGTEMFTTKFFKQ